MQLLGTLRLEEAARRERAALVAEREKLAEKLQEMAPRAGFETVGELSQAFKRWGPLEGRAKRLESLRTDAKEAEGKVTSCKQRACAELNKMGLHAQPAEIHLNLLQKAEKDVVRYLREGENFRRLTTVEIPNRQQTLLSAEKVKGMTVTLKKLTHDIEKMAAEKPELANLQLTETHSEYEKQWHTSEAQITDSKDQRRTVSAEVLNIEERYRKEYPRLANEVAELKDTLDKTDRFQKAVSIAIKTLQEISARSHAQWATALNPRANDILKHLNPRCRELKFDRDLSFTVIPAEGASPIDRKMIEAQQSVGARHQIYLAVRLALTDYLSAAGKSLPVILDDPFATSDDDRFLSGMSFLCREFQKNHQLIILTCHRQRHTELLKQEFPGLTDEIQLIELSPAR